MILRRAILVGMLASLLPRFADAQKGPKVIVLGAGITSPILNVSPFAPKRDMSLRFWLVCNGAEAHRTVSDRTAAHRVQAGRAGLTDTFASGRKSPFMKAGCGKTARPVCAADGGQRKSNRARLLRPDTCEATEQGEATPGGSRGGKGLTQGEQPLGGRGSDTEPKCRVDPNNGCASDDGRH